MNQVTTMAPPRLLTFEQRVRMRWPTAWRSEASGAVWRTDDFYDGDDNGPLGYSWDEAAKDPSVTAFFAKREHKAEVAARART